jgi:23S rRNA (uracil1939-C5)-methyltransferase
MPSGETVELTIERVGLRGDGIAHWQDEAVFVPFTAPGDVIRVALGPKRGEGRTAELREIVAPGARVAAPCMHFGTCGGCALQHLDDAAYTATKLHWLETALAQQRLTPETIAPLTQFPRAIRRRARFQLDGTRVGFHARGSHKLVDLRECLVLHPKLMALLSALRSTKATAASATLADNGIDLLLDLKRAPDLPRLEALATLAEQHDLARLSWREGDRVTPLAERRKPVVTLSDVGVVLPDDAFLQASKEAEAALVAAVIDLIGDAKHVADLYSGIGTFSFALAKRAKLHAVEGHAGAVAALTQAALRAGLAGVVSAEPRDLARRPLDEKELGRFDAVVFDPPYAGAKEQCRSLAQSGVSRIVAVSCNPASFARDARILVDGGYRLTVVRPFDAFLWSANLELVAAFERS